MESTRLLGLCLVFHFLSYQLCIYRIGKPDHLKGLSYARTCTFILMVLNIDDLRSKTLDGFINGFVVAGSFCHINCNIPFFKKFAEEYHGQINHIVQDGNNH